MRFGSGDDGKSSVFGSGRIWKDEDIFEALGVVDELNSFIGLAISFCDDNFSDIKNILLKIQGDLFKIGSMLAALNSNYLDKVPKIDVGDVSFLEGELEKILSSVGDLNSFILPGGSKLASILHVARTICRRAERRVVKLRRNMGVPDVVLKYLNRLSTLLFHLARYVNKISGVGDVEWRG